MFRLTKDEFTEVVTICDHLQKLKYRPTLPYALTEQEFAMLETIKKKKKAIDVNIQIMRVFIQLRSYVLSNETLNEQIVELRKLLMLHIENNNYKFSEHDNAIKRIVQALNNLIEHPPKTKTIGFNTGNG
jgi:hypothetical protein